jgi:superfamily II DNA/RNA helicase
MNFKKLLPELVLGIDDAGLNKSLKEIHSEVIPKVKSGADMFVVSPEGSGKSMSIVFSLVQQLKTAIEKSPRAIVVVSTKEKAFELDKQFELIAKHTNLRSLLVYDQGNLKYQKDMIYEGIDVLISTPKRLVELINNSGVPLVKVKILIVDDAEVIFKNNNHTIVHRLADSINKLQILIFSNVWHSKFDSLADRVMKNPVVINK